MGNCCAARVGVYTHVTLAYGNAQSTHSLNMRCMIGMLAKFSTVRQSYTHTHARTHSFTRSRTHTLTHSLTHARTHAHAHTHTHTHTHTHMVMPNHIMIMTDCLCAQSTALRVHMNQHILRLQSTAKLQD